MDFIKNLKGKFNEHNIFADNGNNHDDVYDEDYDNSDYDEFENGYDDYQEDDNNAFDEDDGLGAPEYTSYASSEKNSFKSKASSKASSASSYSSSSASASSASSANKGTGNIYNMNTPNNQNKYKLNSILLRDIYDAKNVASLLMDKDTIVIVNFSLLTDAQKIRAMDFLDGVKLVTKSIFARFTENIGTYVPDGVELYGDFFSQIDIESFK